MNFYLRNYEETLPPQTVLYFRRTGSYGPENLPLMQRMKTWLMQNDLMHGDTVILAIALDNPQTTAPEHCRYDVCAVTDAVPTSASAHAPAQRMLSGGDYLTYVIDHTPAALQAAWDDCLPETIRLGYQPDSTRPMLERYPAPLIERHQCEFCVPICRQSS